MYDYIITKPPLDEEFLEHHGVLGMKWGVRHDPERKGRKSSGNGSIKKAAKKSRGSFTQRSANRVGSTAKNVANMWGNSAGRGEKLVKEGNSKDYGYFDAKKDTGYLKAFGRGFGRQLQISAVGLTANVPIVLLSKKFPVGSAVAGDILKKAVAAASTASTIKTVADVINTRDVRNYEKSKKKG